MEWPTVSIIVSTYNCRENAKKCFERIISQDYEKAKLDMIASDSYSTDGTIQALEEIGVRVIKSRTSRPEGLGQAKWVGYKNAKGSIIIYVDSDVFINEKDWIKKMVFPLINDKTVNFCFSRMKIDQNDSLTNQYFTIMGTDPFLSYCSFDSLVSMNKLRLKDCGEYYTHDITPENFYITGGYALAIRKKTLDDLGGYSQDIDISYKLAKMGFVRVAIPKNTTVHHIMMNSMIYFIKKKFRLGRIYFEQGHKDQAFNWKLDSPYEKSKIAIRIYKNFIFFPELFVALYFLAKTQHKAWLLHPMMMWLGTASYVMAYLTKESNPEKSRFKSQGGI